MSDDMDDNAPLYEPPDDNDYPIVETPIPSPGAFAKATKKEEIGTGWKDKKKKKTRASRAIKPFRYFLMGVIATLAGFILVYIGYNSMTAYPALPDTFEVAQQNAFEENGYLIDVTQGKEFMKPQVLTQAYVNLSDYADNVRIEAVKLNKCIVLQGNTADGIDPGEIEMWSVENAHQSTLFCSIDEWLPYMHDQIPHVHRFLWIEIAHGPENQTPQGSISQDPSKQQTQ